MARKSWRDHVVSGMRELFAEIPHLVRGPGESMDEHDARIAITGELERIAQPVRRATIDRFANGQLNGLVAG